VKVRDTTDIVELKYQHASSSSSSSFLEQNTFSLNAYTTPFQFRQTTCLFALSGGRHHLLFFATVCLLLLLHSVEIMFGFCLEVEWFFVLPSPYIFPLHPFFFILFVFILFYLFISHSTFKLFIQALHYYLFSTWDSS